MAKTTKRKINRIRKLRGEGASYAEIHRRTGVSRTTAKKYAEDVSVSQEPPVDHAVAEAAPDQQPKDYPEEVRQGADVHESESSLSDDFFEAEKREGELFIKVLGGVMLVLAIVGWWIKG